MDPTPSSLYVTWEQLQALNANFSYDMKEAKIRLLQLVDREFDSMSRHVSSQEKRIHEAKDLVEKQNEEFSIELQRMSISFPILSSVPSRFYEMAQNLTSHPTGVRDEVEAKSGEMRRLSELSATATKRITELSSTQAEHIEKSVSQQVEANDHMGTLSSDVKAMRTYMQQIQTSLSAQSELGTQLDEAKQIAANNLKDLNAERSSRAEFEKKLMQMELERDKLAICLEEAQKDIEKLKGEKKEGETAFRDLQKELSDTTRQLAKTRSDLEIMQEMNQEDVRAELRAERIARSEVEETLRLEKLNRGKVEKLLTMRELELKREKLEKEMLQREKDNRERSSDDQRDLKKQLSNVQMKDKEEQCSLCGETFKTVLNKHGDCIFHPGSLERHCRPCNKWLKMGVQGSAGEVCENALGNCWYDSYRWTCCHNVDRYASGCTLGMHAAS
jgi:hypothetical protein